MCSVCVPSLHEQHVNNLLLSQEDLQDMFEDMNEINDMMGRAYGVPDELDEAVGNCGGYICPVARPAFCVALDCLASRVNTFTRISTLSWHA